jgi:type IV fimbrial biogenesis protein FimT
MFAQRPRGMTMIELLVALAILVIVLAIGVPNFSGVANSSRLSANINELTAAVQLARAEALRRNRNVVMCRSTNLSTCSNGTGWSAWMVFVDANNDGQASAGEEVIKAGRIDAPLVLLASPALVSLNDRITFMAGGLARGADDSVLLNASLALCVASTQPTLNTRDLSIAFGGRTSVRSRSGGGTCTAPADT